MNLHSSKHFRSAGETSSRSNLIHECLQGDQGAWETLVHSYENLIYSLCAKYRARDRDTGDLVQDVLIRVFQELGRFRGDEASLKGWIIRITRNLIIDDYRRARTYRLNDSLSTCGSRIEDQHEAFSDPDSIIQSKQAGAYWTKALQNLRPERRTVIIMRAIHDMEYSDIARMLAIPEGTVKSRLSRGRADLLRLTVQRPR